MTCRSPRSRGRRDRIRVQADCSHIPPSLWGVAGGVELGLVVFVHTPVVHLLLPPPPLVATQESGVDGVFARAQRWYILLPPVSSRVLCVQYWCRLLYVRCCPSACGRMTKRKRNSQSKMLSVHPASESVVRVRADSQASCLSCLTLLMNKWLQVPYSSFG